MNPLTKSTEDYLEAILVIGLDKKTIRKKHIAKHLKVKMPSVASAIKRLAQGNLVKNEHYGEVELTKKGRDLAKSIYKRHKTVSKFLNNFLGIDSAIAEKDACKIEHYLSSQATSRLLKFIEFLENYPQEEETWLSSFYNFVQTGKCKSCRKDKNRKKANRRKL